LLFLLIILVFFSESSYGRNFKIDTKKSAFLMVTEPGGFTGFGHNHVIMAPVYTEHLAIPTKDPATIKFSITIQTKALVVGDDKITTKWYPKLKGLGILTEMLDKVDPEDRASIYEDAIGDEQLNAAAFPHMRASVVSVKKGPIKIGVVSFSHQMAVMIEIHGKVVTAKCPANLILGGKIFKGQAVCKLKFTSFGIEPISIGLGAVTNEDDFHLYVDLTANQV
jgi:hypothetical protein